MIRNRMNQLIAKKQSRRGAYVAARSNLVGYQPIWFEDYYEQKEILQKIRQNNQNIAMLANQYQGNPTVYSLKQVERLISQNCTLIDESDRWVTNFKYSSVHENPGLRETEKGICKHFQSALSEEIMSIFNSKQIIASVNNELDHHNSQFSFSQLNRSGVSLNNRSFMGESEDRNRVFQEVSYKIENLNIILRRMNTMVAEQGDLVNRIDDNLVAGHENMRKANEQLRRRVEKEEGSGQFSCEGKVNQAITGMYMVNIILIAIFFIKNAFF